MVDEFVDEAGFHRSSSIFFPITDMPEDTYKLAISSLPDVERARQIGTALVKMQLAACVNVLPAVQSIYRWKGGIEIADEVMLLIKTTAANLRTVEAELKAMHPYELPEFITVPIESGSSAYLAWLSASTIDG